MDKEINPVIAGLVILLVILCIGAYMWSDGLAQSVSGPGHMHLDGQGNLYLSSDNHILKFDAQGKLLQDYSLENFGITNLTGDFGVFRNGDLLISPISFNPDFLEGLATFLRREEMARKERSELGGLVRCDLAADRCRNFIATDTPYDHSFFLEVDQATESVYLADTSRHRVLKYNAEGEKVAHNDSDWEYPNRLLLHDDQLLVIDTNHFRIRALDSNSAKLADLSSGARNGMPPEARNNGHRFPANMIRVADQWWLIIMDNAMSNGGLYRFDDKWVYRDYLPLPEDANPLAILPFNDRVLVSDPINMKVYQFDHYGRQLSDFTPDALLSHVAGLQKKKDDFRTLGQQVMGGLIFAIILALVAAYRTGKSPNLPAQEIPKAEKSQVKIDDLNITWLEPDKTLLKKKILLPGAILFIALLVPMGLILINIKEGSWYLWAQFAILMIVLPGLAFYVFHVQYGSRIGYFGNSLILRDYKGRTALGQGKYILYNSQFLFIEKVMVALGQNNLPTFRAKDMVDHVYPRLKDATEITQRQAQTIMIQRYQPLLLGFLLLLVGGLVAVVMMS